MTINKKEHFQEVTPNEGYLLYLDGEYFEGVCCSLDVIPYEIYIEKTQEEYDKYLQEQEELSLQNLELIEENENGSNNSGTNN